METVSAVPPAGATEGRERSAIGFPAYGLADSVAVADTIHNKGGGLVNRGQLAALLDYKSTQNGAFMSRMSSAKMFNLVAEQAGQLSLTATATMILMPESIDQQRAALVNAFLAVPLFKAIYNEYLGKELPQGLGLQNAMRNRFKIAPKRIDIAIKNFFESAEKANFFETRGSKTQLIIPVIRTAKTPPPVVEREHHDEGGGGNGGGGGGEPPAQHQVKSRDDLQNDYIAALIELLRAKNKQGELDEQLAEKIERLLDLKSA